MRRRIIQRRVVVFLLLLLAGGTIVNVAVAWGCVLWSPLQQEEGWQFFDAAETPPYVPDDWHSFANDWMSCYRETFGLTLEQYLRTGKKEERFCNFSIHVIRAGWPTACMSCKGHSDSPPQAGRVYRFERKFEWTLGLTSPDWVRGRYFVCGFGVEFFRPPLPLRILWTGFAINTIFYAAMLWVVFFVPGKLKRTLRRRRGLCPACGYPVGSSPVCTECGKPLKFRKCMGLPPPATPAC